MNYSRPRATWSNVYLRPLDAHSLTAINKKFKSETRKDSLSKDDEHNNTDESCTYGHTHDKKIHI